MDEELPPRDAPGTVGVIDPLVGQTFHERFKITALLARGGMGRVYRAEQAPLGRVCAIKVLTAPPSRDGSGESATDGSSEFQRRFFLEASTCAKLTHPNTVTIFDYGRTEENVYYMAMEYLEGRTLQRTISTDGVIDEPRAIHIARQICRSLREAHSLGVIHRDLKPANVFLISHADETDVVKVLDFGLVKNIEAPVDQDVTETGLFMGSPKYMAPEQIQGEVVDGRTDIYALGVLLFEMLTGRVPFERRNHVHVLMAHVHDEVPRLRDVRPDLAVSPALEATIYRCLEKAPGDRFATMDQVMAALKQAAGGVPTGTDEISISDSGPRAAFSASGSFSAHATASVVDGSSGAPMARDDLAPVRARYKGAWAAIGVALGVAALVTAAAAMRKPPVAAATASQSMPSIARTAPPVKGLPSVTGSPIVAAASASAVPITVDSEPSGARIRDREQAILCDKTPCSISVGDAPRLLSVELAGYNVEQIRVEHGDPARHVHLTPKPVVQPRGTTHPTPTPIVNPEWRDVPDIYKK